MKFLVLEILTNTATFRIPDFQNFHKTFSLPPPTTIIGLTGAALGYSPSEAQDFFDKNNFKFGVYGEFAGKAKDLWKYQKPLKGSELYNYRPEFGSIIIKEFLYKNKFLIALGSEDENWLLQLADAFKNPKFALTLGNSDSLAFVKNMDFIEETVKENKVKNCLAEGDIVDQVLSNPNKNLEYSLFLTADPIAYDIPVRFNYEAPYGRRTIRSVKTYSFITSEMLLNFELPGIKYKGVFIPISTL